MIIESFLYFIYFYGHPYLWIQTESRYFCDRIKKLSQSFIDRLLKGVLEDSFILKEEENGITDEDNDIFEDELGENIIAQ